MMTLTLVFNYDMSKVLMCYHNKQRAYNFIGGHVEEGENPRDASYRELEEETGISKDDIELKFVRNESVTTGYCQPWTMYVTTGILKNKDFVLVPEKNRLEWIDVNENEAFLNAFGYGNCYMLMQEAMLVLSKE